MKEAKIVERILPGEPFASAAVRLAEMKARKVAGTESGAIVIGADTIAYLGRRIFRKTENEREARKILSFLSGKTHHVVTGVCVLFPDAACVKYSVGAAVRMKRLEAKTINGYLKTGEWGGRAGSYDVSGKGSKLVECVRGERETVAGLPLRRLRPLLSASSRRKNNRLRRE